MELDLEADVGALLDAVLARPTLVGAIATLVLLVVAGWEPVGRLRDGRFVGGELPRRALVVPSVVAVVAGGGAVTVGAVSTVVRVVLVAVVLVVARLAPRTPVLTDTPALAWLTAVTAAGLFACLPETGGALSLLGGVAVVVAVGPRRRASRLACVAVPLAVGLVAAADGIRPGQVVGGVACLGLVALLPLVSLDPVAGHHLADRIRTPAGFAVLLVTQLLVVVAVARGPGILTAIEPSGYAAPLAIGLLGLATLAHLPARTRVTTSLV